MTSEETQPRHRGSGALSDSDRAYARGVGWVGAAWAALALGASAVFAAAASGTPHTYSVELLSRYSRRSISYFDAGTFTVLSLAIAGLAFLASAAAIAVARRAPHARMFVGSLTAVLIPLAAGALIPSVLMPDEVGNGRAELATLGMVLGGALGGATIIAVPLINRRRRESRPFAGRYEELG
jgi:hypothetical protein